MAWTDSRMFRRTLQNMCNNTVAFDWDTDAIKVALYGTTPIPNKDEVTDVLTGYNGAASQWIVANEISQAVQWPAGGVALASAVVDVATAGVVMLDGADTASGSAATLAAVYGCLVYDDTMVSKQGFSYNYFGGTNSVTNGTFTVVWHANGIIRFTL